MAIMYKQWLGLTHLQNLLGIFDQCIARTSTDRAGLASSAMAELQTPRHQAAADVARLQ